jgi:hypothetical protein
VTSRDIREILAQELVSTAAWRRDLAARDRRAPGNLHQASALEQLAARIRSLAPDDERLQRIAAANLDPEFFALGGEDTRSLIDQFGAAHVALPVSEEACSAFLDSLAEATARDDEARADHGPGSLRTHLPGEKDSPP